MKKQLSEKKLAPIFRRGDCCCCTFAPSFKSDQCDQIGRFLKVFCQKFLIKVSKIFYCFEGHLQKCPFSSKACCGNFWTTFGNFGYFSFQYLVTLSLIEELIKKCPSRVALFERSKNAANRLRSSALILEQFVSWKRKLSLKMVQKWRIGN